MQALPCELPAESSRSLSLEEQPPLASSQALSGRTSDATSSAGDPAGAVKEAAAQHAASAPVPPAPRQRRPRTPSARGAPEAPLALEEIPEEPSSELAAMFRAELGSSSNNAVQARLIRAAAARSLGDGSLLNNLDPLRTPHQDLIRYVEPLSQMAEAREEALPNTDPANGGGDAEPSCPAWPPIFARLAPGAGENFGTPGSLGLGSASASPTSPAWQPANLAAFLLQARINCADSERSDSELDVRTAFEHLRARASGSSGLSPKGSLDAAPSSASSMAHENQLSFGGGLHRALSMPSMRRAALVPAPAAVIQALDVLTSQQGRCEVHPRVHSGRLRVQLPRTNSPLSMIAFQCAVPELRQASTL